MGGASGQGTTTYVVVALLCFSGWRAQGFVCPSIRSSPSVDQRRSLPCSREASRPLLLAVVPPGKAGGGGASSATAGGGTEENGAGFGASDKMKKKITSAPLRITPNFQPHEKRRPKTEINKDITRAFLTEDSFDIAAMAWAEFSDFLRRTVERNVNGAQFEFDIRQWSSSIRKWWSRAVEMDVQAKADLFRLYDRGMQERDAWGNQAVKVDARVEDEWDSIYVDCQDCFEFSDGDADGMKATTADDYATGPQASSYAEVRREGPWSASSLSLSAFDIYQGNGMEEQDEDDVMSAFDDIFQEDGLRVGEEDGGASSESEGFDDEEIIDCAIRGRWTFKNNDDPPHFSPQ